MVNFSPVTRAIYAGGAVRLREEEYLLTATKKKGKEKTVSFG